jgi:hypothetical protein
MFDRDLIAGVLVEIDNNEGITLELANHSLFIPPFLLA